MKDLKLGSKIVFLDAATLKLDTNMGRLNLTANKHGRYRWRRRFR